MTSQAERLRRKRTIFVPKGVPMRAGVERYSNGRIVNRDRRPVETPEEAMATVRAQPHRTALAGIENASKRQFIAGVSAEVLMGSSLGRLLWTGQLQDHHYEAGVKFAKNMARDRATIGLPPCTTQAMTYGDAKGGSYHADDAAAREASARILAAKVVLLNCGEECRGDIVRPGIVVRQVALEDRDNGELSEHEIGALRMGLNALARHYKTEAG